jgi:hypothetical protein
VQGLLGSGDRKVASTSLFALSLCLASASFAETMEESIDRQLTEGFNKLGEEILSDVEDRAKENAVNSHVAEEAIGLYEMMQDCSFELSAESHFRTILLERVSELVDDGFSEAQSLLVADKEYGKGLVILSIREGTPICETIAQHD